MALVNAKKVFENFSVSIMNRNKDFGNKQSRILIWKENKSLNENKTD